MKVLVVAPHPDDETLGVGGTIARHVADGDEVVVAIVTGHGEQDHPLWPRSTWEQVRGEAREAMTVLGVSQLVFEELPAVLVADQPGWKVNAVMDQLVAKARPDVLYVPFPFDLHKDHREIFHALSVTWRPSSELGRGIKQIYCYEVLSETHWNIPYVEAGFLPTTYVDISSHLATKLEALSRYKSQLRPSPDPRSLKAVEALAVLRGHQMGMAAAEAFVTVRQLR